MSRADTREVILVVGAGDATGGAVATRFARGGYTAVVTRRKLDRLSGLVERMRSEDLDVHPFALDPRIEDEVVTLFADVERDIGPLAVVVFNIGPNGASKIPCVSRALTAGPRRLIGAEAAAGPAFETAVAVPGPSGSVARGRACAVNGAAGRAAGGSWSTLSAQTPNIRWVITFRWPRTWIRRPPNSSLRRPLTRSAFERSRRRRRSAGRWSPAGRGPRAPACARGSADWDR